ncbi:MAG: hypothetical protein OEW15_07530 [Nitrospirota bacterium]|nr:hypothetical protein [Nitrospirota bacterium]
MVPFVVLLIVTVAGNAWCEETSYPERRKPQFQTDPGYYLFPSPYSIPGIGAGGALIGLANNIAGTHTDAFGFLLGGEVRGLGLGLADVHLVPKTLILDLFNQNFNAITATSFRQRGMETGKHDYSLMELGNFWFVGERLTATFADRRFEIYGGNYNIKSTLDKIRDNNGNVILDIDDPRPWRTKVYALGTRIDLSDDYADPRSGFRLDVSRWWSPPVNHIDADFYNMEYNATAYVPLGRISTWLINYFRSDAHVNRPGSTDRATVAAEQNLNCSTISDPAERTECEQVIDNIIAANTYGTVSALGGTSRMRSYPNDRFKGAHSVFYATEIRWNLTEEARPFDIFIARDVRTALQIAFFYEMASVADNRDDLREVFRSSYGTGFRMVTASGVVLRFDFATGREGIETSIIFGYPWESF